MGTTPILILMLLPLLALQFTFSTPLPDPELIVQEVNEYDFTHILSKEEKGKVLI